MNKQTNKQINNQTRKVISSSTYCRTGVWKLFCFCKMKWKVLNLNDICFTAELLWVAPEHIKENVRVKGSQKGDIYSMGIILEEVILRSQPFDNYRSTMDVTGGCQANGIALRINFDTVKKKKKKKKKKTHTHRKPHTHTHTETTITQKRKGKEKNPHPPPPHKSHENKQNKNKETKQNKQLKQQQQKQQQQPQTNKYASRYTQQQYPLPARKE